MTYARKVYILGIFISIFSVIAVILTQIGMEYYEYKIKLDGQTHFAIKLLPGLINVAFIGIFGQIYKWLAYKLAIGENH